jgi:predicted nucleotidyltransferase
MDQAAIIPDKAKALEIIGDMHSTLYKYGIKPCHIALFGSFLHGNTHNESDLDMIIISESFEGKDLSERIYMIMNAESEVRKRYVVPMDILMKTPEEYRNQQFYESKIIV